VLCFIEYLGTYIKLPEFVHIVSHTRLTNTVSSVEVYVNKVYEEHVMAKLYGYTNYYSMY